MTRKTETSRKSKDVLHPLLYDASNFIQDEYWKSFFVDMSKGKQTRKIHVDDKVVSHSGKKVSFYYNYDNKDPETIALELRKMIRDTLFIFSESDLSKERESFNQSATEFHQVRAEDDWKKMRTRKMKDHLITDYIMKLKAKYNWNWTQARHAYNVIVCALYHYRTHKSNDITMVNGELSEIDDLTVSATGICNERINAIETETKKPEVKKVDLYKEWHSVCTGAVKRSKQLLCMDSDDIVKKKRVKKGTVTEEKTEVTTATANSSRRVSICNNDDKNESRIDEDELDAYQTGSASSNDDEDECMEPRNDDDEDIDEDDNDDQNDCIQDQDQD